MKWQPFVVPLVLPVAFTAWELVGVQRNRSSDRAPIELSEREITLSTGTDESSGATAWVTWSEPADDWLSRDQLAAIGFNVAIERIGDGRDAARDDGELPQLQRRASIVMALREGQMTRSRLVPVDAATDRGRLLAQYPNGRTHLISAGTIGIRRTAGPTGNTLVGYVASLDPRGIHVPTELSGRLPTARQRVAPFLISVRYGAQLEPWIVDVK